MEPESLLIFWLFIVVLICCISIGYTDFYNALVLAISTGFLLILPFIRSGFDPEIYISKFHRFIIDALEVIFIISLFVIYFYITHTVAANRNSVNVFYV